MKKYFYLTLAIAVILLGAWSYSYAQMAVAWDPYTDTGATGLRLQQSTDQSNWTTCVDNISIGDTSLEVPTYSQENTRVYYRLLAFNAEEVSEPSNVVSYFWTTGGGGYEGLATPGLIRWIDCKNPKDGGEQQICQDLGLSNN